MCIVAFKSQLCAEVNIEIKENMVIDPTMKPRACRRRSSTSSTSSGRRTKRTYVEHNYCDHYDDPIYHPGETGEEDGEAPKRRGPRGGVVVPFPERLYNMLCQVENDGYEDVVSWQPHGRCFIVHEPKRFVEEVMPKYFRQSKLTSFQRQVNLYGFRRLTAGKDRGAYYHELFLRGRPDLHKRLVRIRVKGTGFKSASSPATEPNFYTYPRCVEDGSKGLGAKTSNATVPQEELRAEPITSASFFEAAREGPLDPSWKPLSAPPKMMVVTPRLKPVESPSMMDDIKHTEDSTEQLWNQKFGSSDSMTLSSMAKSIARCSTSQAERRKEPCPVSPEGNVRQLVSSGLEQALAMVSPVDSPSPSPFPSMVSLTEVDDSSHQQQEQHNAPTALAIMPDLVDSRMDNFQEGIEALLSADLADWDVSQNTLLDDTQAPDDYALDPLYLLDDIAGTIY